jgi:hypothetical protein
MHFVDERRGGTMRISVGIFVGAAVVAATVLPSADALGQTRQPEGHKVTIEVPPSLQTEHEAIHDALTEATRAPGRVGAAAKELATILHPHFEREDEIALPPLGLLAPLAAGETPVGMEEALAMTDALRKELPRMLEEHEQIRAATEKLRRVAREEKLPQHERFAEQLVLHARSEEEVLYPAAILVGDIIRARLGQR